MNESELLASGWEPLPGASHFNATAGPFWRRLSVEGLSAEGLEIGLLTGEQHSNGNIGTVHGGVLMTFADTALGCKVAEVLGNAFCTTLQLSFNFTATAKLGSFLTCRPELVRRTSQIVFVRGLVMAGERTIGAADGIWKVLEPEKFASLRG